MKKTNKFNYFIKFNIVLNLVQLSIFNADGLLV